MKHGPDNEPLQHTIRLRGPCKLFWMRNGTQQAEVRVQIPCEIKPDLFELTKVSAGDRFVLQRNFGKPTRLEPSQSVTLELSKFEGADRIVFNPGKISELALDFETNSVSIEVAKSLLDQNRLDVEFCSLPACAGDIRMLIS